MAGTSDDPGLMVLSLQAIFALIMKQEIEYEFEVTCSYLEVYNEVYNSSISNNYTFCLFTKELTSKVGTCIETNFVSPDVERDFKHNHHNPLKTTKPLYLLHND